MSQFVGLTVIVLVCFTAIIFPTPFISLDNRIYDVKLRYLGPAEVDSAIVHLDIDDRAIKEYGSWPWDRNLSARIVERLTDFGAKLIIFDILYSSKGLSDPGNEDFFSAIKNSGRVVSSTAFGITDNSEIPLNVTAEPSKVEALYGRSWNIPIPTSIKLRRVFKIGESHVPLEPISTNSKAVGHIKSTPDPDGVHRRVPALIHFEDKVIPSLALAAYVSLLEIPAEMIQVTNKGISIPNPAGERHIITDNRMNLLISWRPIWKTFPHYSAVDVLSEKVDQKTSNRFKDKIVVIGVTWTGATDLGLTPLNVDCPLSRIHSNSLNTMLTSSYIRNMTQWPFVIVTCFFTVIWFFFSRRLRLLVLSITGAIFISLYIVGVIAAFWAVRTEIPSAAPMSIFLTGFIASLITGGLRYESEAQHVSSALARYVSPQMLESLKGNADIDLTTKRKELTVLFADVAGFSSISETMDAEYVAQFLNDFFDSMTRIIFEHGGTVDKFLGDGLLAFFGDPVVLDNHAEAGLNAARAMQREMEVLNTRWTRVGIREMESGIKIRIGITTGMMVVGNIGSKRRMEYTVLGSVVNLASRLQTIAEPGGILASARTCALAGESIKCGPTKHIKVRGFDREVSVREVSV